MAFGTEVGDIHLLPYGFGIVSGLDVVSTVTVITRSRNCQLALLEGLSVYTFFIGLDKGCFWKLMHFF
jgi:hypothetical protein